MKEEKPNKKVQELLIQAQNYLKDNRLNDLEKVLKEIILIDANFFPALFNLGKLSEKSKNYEKAINFYEKTLKINPNHLDSILNLTNCYEDIGKLDKAVKISENSCKLFPEKFEVHFNNARLNHKKRINLDKALESYKKALAINNNLIVAKIGLGQIYKSQGNFTKAKKVFQEIINSNNNEIIAYYEIIDFLNNDEIKNNIKYLEILEKKNKQTDGQNIFLYFSLGKMFEKVNDKKKSIHYYNLGNSLKNKYSDYSIENDEKRFDLIKKIINNFGSNKNNNIGYNSKLSIFIVGMPRSGTSLVEQIIASHSKVEGGGEFCNFTDYFRNLNYKNNNNLEETLNKITEKDFSIVGKSYTNKIKEFLNKKKYFTNKLPGNFINIALIKLCLPNAKIIHCNRNSIDTCFSCYKTLFSEGNTFSYSLKNLGSFYNFYKKQMEYYKKTFNKEILNINYEEIISDSKKEIKRILEYLELNFEKNCLEFHKNKRPVHTASLVQVRKPLYKSSINQWSKYKNFIKPLIDEIKN